MNKRNNKSILRRAAALVFVAVLAFCYTPSAYAASDSTEVINNVSISDVNIDLTMYTMQDGQKVAAPKNELVFPGSALDRISEIRNIARPVWIRATMVYDNGDLEENVSDLVLLNASDWIRKVAYYYYSEVVDTDETIEFTKQIKIPSSWDNSYSNKSFGMTLKVEAVQAENFTPNFSSDDPWFGTVIEQCVHGTYTKHSNSVSNTFFITYQGGAEGLVRIGDDFFSNWGELMPGDVVTDTVELRNNYSKPVTILFKTKTIANDELLDALKLTIKCEEKLIYSGPLKGEIEKAIELAKLDTGDSATLEYTLEVPTWLNNKYALSETKTEWIFIVEIDESDKGIPTGDSMSDYLLGVFTATTMTIFFAVLLALSKRKKDEKQSRKGSDFHA